MGPSPRPFDPVAVRRLLEAELGPDAIVAAADGLESYARDETPFIAAPPDLAVLPRTAAEVAAVLKLATAHRFPVVPRGAGTGVVAGALAVGGGVVLSLERMNRILEIDAGNMMAVVEPAVITGQLQREAAAVGLFYPPDPQSADSCSIGGNVATGAGGPRAVKYGVTRDYVTGCELVVPTGEILPLGGKIVKYATGYHLLDLVIGSEGTLGVVTQVTLRLLPLPGHRASLLVPFATLAEAAGAVAEIVRRRLRPAAIEFMDAGAIDASRRFLEREMRFPDAGAHLVVEVDGDTAEAVAAAYEAIGELCLARGAADVLVADGRAEQEALWKARRVVGEAVRSQNRDVAKQDVVVPRMAIPELVARLREIGSRAGAPVICFGHAGDGNVHVNILAGQLEGEAWARAKAEVFPALIREVYRLGGVLSGEHGIGWLKKTELAGVLPARHLEIMRGIKRVFDPAGILNPGKVFDSLS
ncbi:MAG TPA: FAD-linked oxidase C-terminal domain-containing protein [bacterium]